MAMGRKQPLQPLLFITHAQIPQSAGHPFYPALDGTLSQGGFDAFVESVCQSATPLPLVDPRWLRACTFASCLSDSLS